MKLRIPGSDHTVLFICTANYYRSRFAEALFNHGAELRGLRWRAFSRGLAIHLADGDLAWQTRDALELRGIPLHHTAATRQPVDALVLRKSARVIALDREEHQPIIERLWPEWAKRVEYWEVPDIHLVDALTALEAIERRVEGLLDALR